MMRKRCRITACKLLVRLAFLPLEHAFRTVVTRKGQREPAPHQAVNGWPGFISHSTLMICQRPLNLVTCRWSIQVAASVGIGEAAPLLDLWRPAPKYDSVISASGCFEMPRTSRPVTVTLGDLQERVDTRVQSGAYASASEVMRAALRALDREEAAIDEWMRRQIEESLNDPRSNAPADEVLARLRTNHARERKKRRAK